MRFLVDGMCGGIVSYLRMCGYDTVYASDVGLEADDALVEATNADDRTLLTRDVELAGRLPDSRVVCLESTAVERQLRELVAAGISLELTAEPQRCGRCNGRLTQCMATDSTPAYAPDPATVPVWRCPDCYQHFWRGSHWDRVATTLERVRSETV